MSITNRQFKWLEKRVSTKCYEGGLKGKSPDAIMASIVNDTKVLRYVGKVDFLADCEGNVYLLDYHGTHMYVVINEEHGFVAWRLGALSAWPYENERKRMFAMAAFGVDPELKFDGLSILF